MSHIQSEGLGKAVLAVVPLWNRQFDLAVEQASIWEVTHQFKDYTPYRLKTTDPLFTAMSGESQDQAALRALKGIRNEYRKRGRNAVSDESGNRTRIEVWHSTEIDDFEKRIRSLEARVSICHIPGHSFRAH